MSIPSFDHHHGQQPAVSSQNAMVPAVPLQVMRLVFQVNNKGKMTEYPGFIWRGALGRQLRDMVCVTQLPDCQACLLQQNCAFPSLFAPSMSPDPGFALEFPNAPAPFVLYPEHAWSLEARSYIHLRLVVVAQAAQHTPYLLYALQRAGQRGVGKPAARLHLLRVEQETLPGNGQWQTIYYADAPFIQPMAPQPPVSSIAPERKQQGCIDLITPLRLRLQEQYVRDAESFSFPGFFNTLLRRMTYFAHGASAATEVGDHLALTALGREVKVRVDQMQHHAWQRWSSRQKRSIPMDGVTGTIQLEGAALAQLWPWLALGQWLHVGKGATMGLGAYRLR